MVADACSRPHWELEHCAHRESRPSCDADVGVCWFVDVGGVCNVAVSLGVSLDATRRTRSC